MAVTNQKRLALLLALSVIPMSPGLAQDRLGEAAMGSSSVPGQHEAQSESLSDHMGHSEDLADQIEQSEDIHDHADVSENLDEMLGSASSPGPHEGRSDDLSTLPDARVADADAEAQNLEEVERHDDAGSANPLNSEIESIQALKKQLAEARARAERADHAYADMRQRGYPRGEAAQKIIDERAISKRAVAELEDRYNQLLGAASPQ